MEVAMPLVSSLEAIPKYLPNLAANYTKRFLERGYDQLFRTSFGQWLVSLSPWKKYSIESLLYALTALLDERLPADSPARKYASQVVLDAAPEISKRMINGFRDEVAALVAGAKNHQEKEVLAAVLSLEDSDISGLMHWLGQKKSQRDSILGLLSRLSFEERVKFFGLSDKVKKQVLSFFSPFALESQSVGSSEPAFGEVLRQDMAKGAERLRGIKERMRQQRKRGRQ